jgi:hypothetical protein
MLKLKWFLTAHVNIFQIFVRGREIVKNLNSFNGFLIRPIWQSNISPTKDHNETAELHRIDIQQKYVTAT